MKTLIIRIHPLETGSYPVSLFELAPPAAGAAGPLAPVELAAPATHIPETLQLPGMGPPVFTPDEMRDKLRAASTPQPDLLPIGEQLYALLARDQLAAHLENIDASTRVVLDIQAPGLRSLPWELLCRDKWFLFLDDQQPFCRGSLPEGERVPAHGWPLRIMIVVGSEAGDEAVAEADELDGISDALLNVDPDIDLRVLKRPSFGELQGQLHEFQPHIFHFLGHGGTELTAGKEAYLVLSPVEGKSVEWLPESILTSMKQAGSVRLAFVNACRTDDAAKDGLWSVTDAFCNAGVPAVVGMRTDVAGTDAARFAAAFYGALAAGSPLDVAMAKARDQVRAKHSQGLRRREWASPSLQVAGLPEEILSFGAHIDSSQRLAVRNIQGLKTMRLDVVDRHEPRRTAWRRFIDEKHSLLVIRGVKGVGKSQFAHLVMERCVLCGHNVRYINLRKQRGEFIHLLRLARHGEGKLPSSARLLTSPLDDEGFQEFDATVSGILNKPLKDFEDRMTDEQYVQALEILTAFRKGLERVAQAAPLVLVFDHFEDFEKSEFEDWLMPELWYWCASRPTQDVVMVLVLTPLEYDQLAMVELEGDFGLIDVPLFRAEEWNELAWDFIRRHIMTRQFQNESERVAKLTKARSFVAMAYDMWIEGKDWKPHELHRL